MKTNMLPAEALEQFVKNQKDYDSLNDMYKKMQSIVYRLEGWEDPKIKTDPQVDFSDVQEMATSEVLELILVKILAHLHNLERENKKLLPKLIQKHESNN